MFAGPCMRRSVSTPRRSCARRRVVRWLFSISAARFMSCIRRLAPAVLAVAFCAHGAEEKKDEKKKELPEITASIPFALSVGATNHFKVRGLNLTNATGLRFISDANLPAKITSRGKAKVPDKADAKKVG